MMLLCDPQRIYADLLPLYFPRTQQEAKFASMALPADVGEFTLCALVVMA